MVEKDHWHIWKRHWDRAEYILVGFWGLPPVFSGRGCRLSQPLYCSTQRFCITTSMLCRTNQDFHRLGAIPRLAATTHHESGRSQPKSSILRFEYYCMLPNSSHSSDSWFSHIARDWHRARRWQEGWSRECYHELMYNLLFWRVLVPKGYFSKLSQTLFAQSEAQVALFWNWERALVSMHGFQAGLAVDCQSKINQKYTDLHRVIGSMTIKWEVKWYVATFVVSYFRLTRVFNIDSSWDVTLVERNHV